MTATPDRLANSPKTKPSETDTTSASSLRSEIMAKSYFNSTLKTQRISMYPLSQSLMVLVISNEIDVDVIAEINICML